MYLGDLVSDHPKYAHPDCGSFFTFGWCSEREMAFVLLMETYGYQGKVVTNGNHSWAEFLIGLHNLHGQRQNFISRIDNTFDGLTWEMFSRDDSPETWLAERGSERLHRWYNQQAHASTEREVVALLQVSPTAMERMAAQVHAYLLGPRR